MTFAILAFLIIAAAWDAVVLWRWGLESGRTLSWITYTEARNWPILGFLAGYACGMLTGPFALVFLFGAVMGHIFGTMRGA